MMVLLVSTGGCLDIFGSDDGKRSRTEWAYGMTGIVDMNDDGFTGAGVLVGIVDTGIDASHESLKGISISSWRDFVQEREEPYDDNGHGSHVAGIIAGGGQIKGAARGVGLIVAKALDDEGRGSDSVVADAIDWCVAEGAEVLCLSLGGQQRFLNIGDETNAACTRAVDQGVLVVAAAGNRGEGSEDVDTPGGNEGVITAGAIDGDRKIAEFSSKGDNDGRTPLPYPFDTDRQDPNKKPECVGPGVGIVSAWKDGGYTAASGTSQATAFVAAIAALELEAHPEYSRQDRDQVTRFKEALMDSCEKCPGQDTPHDDRYGYGLIHAVELSRAL